jgi:hypothetical protein
VPKRVPKRSSISASGRGNSPDEAGACAIRALDKKVPKGWALINGTMRSNPPEQIGGGRFQVTITGTIVSGG